MYSHNIFIFSTIKRLHVVHNALFHSITKHIYINYRINYEKSKMFQFVSNYDEIERDK